MAQVFLNDIGYNPWTLAEVGPVTDSNVKVAYFSWQEGMSADHEATLIDSHGRPVCTLRDDQRTIDFNGWVHGLTVERLDSGYVLVSLATGI